MADRVQYYAAALVGACGVRGISLDDKSLLRSNLTKLLILAGDELGLWCSPSRCPIVDATLNSIDASLGGGISGLQWLVSSYTIAFAALTSTAGALGDLLDAKRAFMAGSVVFTVTPRGLIAGARQLNETTAVHYIASGGNACLTTSKSTGARTPSMSTATPRSCGCCATCWA